MLVRLQHRKVAVADSIFDQPVLPGLEARGLAQVVAEPRVFRRRHGPQHVPGGIELFEDARHARQHLQRLGGVVFRDHAPCSLNLVERELHPQFRGLVLDDEQHLVMGLGQRLLRRQDMVDLQIVAIGHALPEIGLGAVFGRIIGHSGFPCC